MIPTMTRVVFLPKRFIHPFIFLILYDFVSPQNHSAFEIAKTSINIPNDMMNIPAN